MSRETLCGAYCFETALGTMGIVWRGDRVIGTQLPEQSKGALLAKLAEKTKGAPLHRDLAVPSFVKDLAKKISLHLQGKFQDFSPAILDLETTSPFFKTVYKTAMKVPAGKTVSYGELAKMAGSPLASRAVGQAMARNPFVLVVPCHRVVGSTKKLVGFSARGGVRTKETLLKLEDHQ